MKRIMKTPPKAKPDPTGAPAASPPAAASPKPTPAASPKPTPAASPKPAPAASPKPAPVASPKTAPAAPAAPAPKVATTKPATPAPAAAAPAGGGKHPPASPKPSSTSSTASPLPPAAAAAPKGSNVPSTSASSAASPKATSLATTTSNASPKGSFAASGPASPPAPPGLAAKPGAPAAAKPKPVLNAHVDPAAPPPAPAPAARATPVKAATPAPAATPKKTVSVPAKCPAAKPAVAGGAATPAAPAVKKTAPPAKPPSPKPAPAPAAAAAAGAPTDEPDVTVKGRKYVYDYVRSKWIESDCQVCVLHPNRGLSQGAMRVCFEVEEILPDGKKRPMVAKMFRRNITHVVEKDYFNECQAQCLCEEFAHNFNEMEFIPVTTDKEPNGAPLARPHVEFVQCHIVRLPHTAIPGTYKTKRTGFFSYRTEDTQAMMFALEPKLSGFFTKYTNNFGGVYSNSEGKVSPEENLRRRRLLRAGEAFSHFTLVESGGSMLVCDLQGVNDFLTDPQIHTEDGKGLGMGNMGQEGIDKWVEKHVCNEYCQGFALQKLEFGSMLRSGRQESYYNALNARLQSQSPVRPQDLVPLPKPLEEMTDDERLDYTIRLSQLLES